MKLTIKLDLENEAFEGGKCGAEISRILADLAYQLDGYSLDEIPNINRSLRDENGNTVGHAKGKK